MLQDVSKMVVIVVAFAAANAANISVTTDGDVIYGQPAIFKGTVRNVGNSTLSWVVGTKYIANATIRVIGEQVNISQMSDSDNRTYAYSFEKNGLNVTTNLTLDLPDFSFGGTTITLTDGRAVSNVHAIIVICNSLPVGASPSCSSLDCQTNVSVNVKATPQINITCSKTYVCSNNGSWISSDSTCPQICPDSRKWGENCTANCSSGCPPNSVDGRRICFRNGRCANSTFMNVAACEEGYAGDLCDRMETLNTNSTITATSPAGTSQSTVLAKTQKVTEAPTGASQSNTEATTQAATSYDEMTLQECNSQPSTPCSKAGVVTAVRSNCSDGGVESICVSPWKCGQDENWSLSGNTSCHRFCAEPAGTWGANCTQNCSLGCRAEDDTRVLCEMDSSRCIDPNTKRMKNEGDCAARYEGDNCERESCTEDCNVGMCANLKMCGGCSRNYEWQKTCYKATCETWGPNCTKACSPGCRVGNYTIYCDPNNGRCIHPINGQYRAADECAEGYRGENCETPICGDCNGGECLAPGLCGDCPAHHAYGKTCRNIRLDGFTKGSLPSLAILAVILILLTYASRWYIRSKIKQE